MPRKPTTGSDSGTPGDHPDDATRIAQLEAKLEEALARIEQLEARPAARRPETEESRKRRLEAANRGSAKVSERYRDVLTRSKYAEQVGVSTVTVTKWVKAGVITPTLRNDISGNVPTNVFSEADVVLGKAIREIQSQRPGKYTVEEAAAEARKTLKARR